jgi:hypothetical protein
MLRMLRGRAAFSAQIVLRAQAVQRVRAVKAAQSVKRSKLHRKARWWHSTINKRNSSSQASLIALCAVRHSLARKLCFAGTPFAESAMPKSRRETCRAPFASKISLNTLHPSRPRTLKRYSKIPWPQSRSRTGSNALAKHNWLQCYFLSGIRMRLLKVKFHLKKIWPVTTGPCTSRWLVMQRPKLLQHISSR